MADHEALVTVLLEEILESGVSPEAACKDRPELLPVVRERLEQFRSLQAQITQLFPPRASSGGDGRVPPKPLKTLPHIPGYDVLEVVGTGGVGVVYKARHLGLDRIVALKMLLAGGYASPRDIQRFQREAQAVAALRHPNIVQVFDAGEHDGFPYFTMEFMEGGSLHQALAGNPLPAPKAAAWIAILARAVQAAHDSGIVHRDLKPGNVLMTTDGTLKVADFGLARRLHGEHQPAITLTGAHVGSPSYMSPEQVVGSTGAVGPGIDVYGLGAILYEMLTGRPPFRGENPIETQRQVVHDDPVPPARLNPRVPKDLQTICLKCLHKDPAGRYATAAGLADDLERFLRNEPILARRISMFSRALRWIRRNPAGAVLLMLVSLLLMSGTGFLVHDQILAAARRENSERVRPQIDEVVQMLREDRELQRAQGMLEQLSGPLDPALHGRVIELQRELLLVARLDNIRLGRIGIIDGRFDMKANCRRAEADFERAFHDAGFAVDVEDPRAAGARIGSMDVCRQLVTALDDWGECAEHPGRGTWIHLVARQADPDPSGWRERFRGPVFDRPQQLQQLADDVQLAAQPVHILVALVEQMRFAGLDSMPFLRRVQQMYPGDFWANFLLGDRLAPDHPQEGIRYLQAAVALRPQAAVAHESLGLALAIAGRMAEARDFFLAATRIEPRFASAYKNLGRARQDLGEHEGARSALEKAVELDPACADGRNHLGCFLLERGDVDAAIRELREAVHIAPAVAEYRESLGKALEAANRPDEAKAEYETMHRLAGDGLRALLVQNRLGEALTATTKAAAMEPRSASSICDLGDCLDRLGRREDAIAEFRSALELESGDDYARERLLGLLTALGRHAEALTVYEQAVADHPEQPQAWEGYAELCLYLGRTDDYRRVCERVFERFGAATDPREYELAGRVCLLLPPEASVLQRATGFIERAVATDLATRAPAQLHLFLLSRALACYRAGRFGDASSSWGNRPMGDLVPAPLFVNAMAFQRTGQTELARRMLGMADLMFDWSPTHATDRFAWLKHVLRREAEALIVPDLPDLLAGRRRPADDEDRAILLAGLCAANHSAAAARLHAELLAGKSNLAMGPARWSRHRAVCIAAAAGAGIGDDADALDDAGRAECRSWARKWLAEELTAKSADLAALPPEQRRQRASELRFWLYDSELAPLREPGALQVLPEAEREECRQLWSRLAVLLASADGGLDAGQSATGPVPTMQSTGR